MYDIYLVRRRQGDLVATNRAVFLRGSFRAVSAPTRLLRSGVLAGLDRSDTETDSLAVKVECRHMLMFILQRVLVVERDRQVQQHTA